MNKIYLITRTLCKQCNIHCSICDDIPEWSCCTSVCVGNKCLKKVYVVFIRLIANIKIFTILTCHAKTSIDSRYAN